MRIWYGVAGHRKDVTAKAFYHFWYDGYIRIPAGDVLRDGVFGDYAPGYKKDVVVVTDVTTVYDNDTVVVVRSDGGGMASREERQRGIMEHPAGLDRLLDIHRQVVFAGVIHEEFPEQLLVATFLHPDARVLEIGANVGHNTMVIASILEDDTRLVTMETLPHIIPVLEKNRSENGMHFHIVHGALSKRPLYQKYTEWIVAPYDPEVRPLASDEFLVNTVTWQELLERFSVVFDTLVVDCEGAFYGMLMDFPEMLNDVRLIILENDFFEKDEKIQVDEQMMARGFVRIHFMGGGWGHCADHFYEVWRRQM